MTSTELKEKEKENAQIDESEWTTTQLGNWTALAIYRQIAVSQYEAYLGYILSDNHLQAAFYDFDETNETNEKYLYLSYALSAVYGENEAASASEVTKLMDNFVQGYYHESDIAEAVKWSTPSAVIYQFYYGPGDFVIFYFNPNFDYSTVNGSQVNVNGL